MSPLQRIDCHHMGAAAAYRPTASKCLSPSWRLNPRRALTCTAVLASGHNRWSKIRHDKARNDERKSKAHALLSNDIVLASRREDNLYSRSARG